MKVSIIIVNYNGWQDTIECLDSVFRLNYPDFNVIVCDNGSTDDSISKMQEWAKGEREPSASGPETVRRLTRPELSAPIPFRVWRRDQIDPSFKGCDDVPLTFIDCMANLGFAGGNNVGLRFALASGESLFFWLLNNDTVVAPDALTYLVCRMKEVPSAGMCGSTLLRYEAPERVQARGGGWYCKWIGLPWHIGQLGRAGDVPDTSRVERWMNYVVGASLFVSREFLEQVGLMCEDYFLFFEETDWAMRAKGRFGLAYAPGSIVYHKIGRSIGTSSLPHRKSFLCDYWGIRNRIVFSQRYFPNVLPCVYLTLCVAMLIRALFGKWDRVTMIFKLIVGIGETRHPSDMVQ